MSAITKSETKISPSSLRRYQCLCIAEVAGQASRYEDVIEQIKIIVEEYGRLEGDERSLLSVAYKNLTNNLRSSWRVVDTLESMESARAPHARQPALIRRARDKLEQELRNVCVDITQLLETRLLPTAHSGEEKVFYAKMMGDYYRYMAEFSQHGNKEKCADLSLNAYKEAYMHAKYTLEPTHPTRLGLALNFSVFFHDVRKSPDRACHLAKNAFDEAIASLTLGEVSEQTAKDSMMILQLLRDDLLLWRQEMDDNEHRSLNS